MIPDRNRRYGDCRVTLETGGAGCGLAAAGGLGLRLGCRDRAWAAGRPLWPVLGGPWGAVRAVRSAGACPAALSRPWLRWPGPGRRPGRRAAGGRGAAPRGWPWAGWWWQPPG